jgi:membrane protease YdiL (CAAX protease family)
MLLDVALAAAVAAAWMTPLILLAKASLKLPAATRALLPRGVFEMVVWAGLSASAGICEEFVFRGYFQRQFAALTKNRWLGVARQAVLFGVHSYQGPSASGLIGLYGAVLGGLAVWRRDLRAAMIAHAFTDLIAGNLSSVTAFAGSVSEVRAGCFSFRAIPLRQSGGRRGHHIGNVRQSVRDL